MWPSKHIPENTVVIDAVSCEMLLLFFFQFFACPRSPLPLFPSLHSLSLFITLSWWPCPRSAAGQEQHLWEPAQLPGRYREPVTGPPHPAAPVAPSQMSLSRMGLLGTPGVAEKSNSRPISRKQCVATFLQTVFIGTNIQHIVIYSWKKRIFFSWVFRTMLWNGRSISNIFTLSVVKTCFFQCALKIDVFKP